MDTQNPSSTIPLLVNPSSSSSSEMDPGHRSSSRRPILGDAARILRRASSRRLMREPSMRVRETAAEQIEDRQTDWAYSKPMVALDILWNLAFVLVSASALYVARKEHPSTPLRVWILGYAFQSAIHMACVWVEYRRRRRRSILVAAQPTQYVSLALLENHATSSTAKHLESANTMFSFIWWIIGFYWVSDGGQDLAHDSPIFYWVCIIFLAFDVFFVVFCVALACAIGIGVCCFLPCIIAILYAVADQEGASKEDIEQLSLYKFQKFHTVEKRNCEIRRGGIMVVCRPNSSTEHILSSEDAECCICLSAYEDGVDLRELPCNHHFHCTCVDKWLRINATCPLCKYNILKVEDEHGEENV